MSMHAAWKKFMEESGEVFNTPAKKELAQWVFYSSPAFLLDDLLDEELLVPGPMSAEKLRRYVREMREGITGSSA